MKRLKKVIALLLTCCAFGVAPLVSGCSTSDNPNQGINGVSKTKLLGNIIPAPKMKYDVINGSDESVYLKVNNATESDFRAYVASCEPYGFDGYIKSANFPDYYFMEYNEDNYFLEIRYYEEEQYFSVYVRVPSQS